MAEPRRSPDPAGSVDHGSRANPWYVWAAAGGLLCVFVFQAMIAARRDSVTIDEFVHLPVGLYYLYTGDFRPDPINPPWTRMIAALPMLPHPPAFDPEPGLSAWGMGYLFERRNPKQYHALFVRARTMIIVLAVVLGMIVFVWARELYGWPAGLASLLLFALSPNMLAHGHLVTLDAAGALGFTASAYVLWRLLEKGSISAAVVAGVVIGVAMLLKLSGFVLVAAAVACIGVRTLERSHGSSGGTRWRWIGLLALAGVVAIVVLNAGYGFAGTLAPLTSTRLDPHGLLTRVAEGFPGLRLPFPRAFVEGVDMVLNVGKQHEPSYFLAGELSSEGWWYYHLVAFAAKTPLPILVVSLVALIAWLARRSPGQREYCLFVPVVIVFTANALFNSLQIGVRHVLPVYPLLFIASGPWIVRGVTAGKKGTGGKAATTVTMAGLVWLAAGTAAVSPRYLQYFNEAAGGPDGGHRVLIDSNIDWGQDLIRLREAMDERGIDTINLAYFGRVDPSIYGIRFRPLEKRLSHGPTAVSASFLMGRPYFWYRRGRMGWVPARTYTWLQHIEPVGRAGSMFLYDLP